MSYIPQDRVQETTTTEGTGPFLRAGAVATYQAFTPAHAIGTVVPYAAVSDSAWEVGYGTLTATHLQRTTILASSNNDEIVNFGAGVKSLFETVPAAEVARIARTTASLEPAATLTGNELLRISQGGVDVSVSLADLEAFFSGGVQVPQATSITLNGPSGGTVSVQSTNFTAAVAPVGGAVSGTVRVTPTDNGGGGSFSPAFLDLTSASPSATFKYTPSAVAGVRQIGVTNNGGLANPSNIAYTSAAAQVVVATGLTLNGPGSGTVSVQSSDFTVGVTPAGGTLSGTVVVTPSDNSGGGTFSPTSVSLTTAAPTATFKYTPSAVAGARTISLANDGGLTNPAGFTFTSAEVGTAATVRTLWTGEPTTDGAIVSARINATNTANSTRIAVSTSSDLSNPVYTAPVTPDEYRITKHKVTGRAADAEYWYAVEVDGVLDTATKGRFRTLPAPGPASFTVALGCCANNTTHNDTPWQAILALKPLAFVFLGDITYSNASHTLEANRIGQYDNVMETKPIRGQVMREIPTIYTWDDHDFGPDNSTGRMDDGTMQPYRQASVDAYRRRSPITLASSAAADTVDYSFVIGRVRFIISDMRADRSGTGLADSAAKTMMGAAQKARWKAEISAAAAAGQYVCWGSSSPWSAGDPGNVGGGVGGDHWGAFATERMELANHIKDAGMGGKVLVICGDMHAMAYREGVDYAWPTSGGMTKVFHIGAMHSPKSIKGDGYTVGPVGADAPTNYAVISVTDDGTNLTIELKGIEAATNTLLISQTFQGLGTPAVTPAAPAAPIAPEAVPANGSVALVITAPSPGTAPITEYEVDVDPDGGTDSQAGTATLSRTITGLPNEEPRKFRVRAKNAVGWSDWSPYSAIVTPSASTSAGFNATGGTVTEPGDGYRYWKFLASETLNVIAEGPVEYLVVGGGASGAASGSGVAGGGGAGRVQRGSITIPTGALPVTVGTGGVGVINATRGTSGGDSSIGSLVVAKGGGAGGSNTSTIAALDGGSGGGQGAADTATRQGLAVPSEVAGEGFNGGLAYPSVTSTERASGGGGGSGSPGGNASLSKGGDGGEGTQVWGVWYAGGGGGTAKNLGPVGLGKAGGSNGAHSAAAANAAPNTGSGGGGTTSNHRSGDGGSGIVIIRRAL